MKTAVNGILLLDKPLGLSSNVALQKTKRLFNAEKAGHTGSLDPLATGMLPLCFGEATKYTRFLLEEKKCYQTTLLLGVTTTTGDSEGEIVATKPVPKLSDALLNELLETFLGQQQQIPPMYSAIKHQGQPLYKLARQGKEIARKARTITISRLTLDKVEQQEEACFLTLTVECSTGTYIRTLAEDMGKFLGCGAHVSALRRLWVWPFHTHPMVTLETLHEGSLIALEEVLPQLLPAVCLNEQQAHFLSRGLQVEVLASAQTGWVALMTHRGTLLGVGEMVGQGRVAPRRLCATN
ncbi:MAG: tRNA pseudouridine(55) synthase TruB [Proteobacteria bacterium]|nr:tRNA pseudouridine(55) synthase TruB [Pseudomonadota bacterium]